MADIREDLPLPTDPTTIVNLPAIHGRVEHLLNKGIKTVCELRKTLCFNLIYQKEVHLRNCGLNLSNRNSVRKSGKTTCEYVLMFKTIESYLSILTCRNFNVNICQSCKGTFLIPSEVATSYLQPAKYGKFKRMKLGR